jgi:hypothetical protein
LSNETKSSARLFVIPHTPSSSSNFRGTGHKKRGGGGSLKWNSYPRGSKHPPRKMMSTMFWVGGRGRLICQIGKRGKKKVNLPLGKVNLFHRESHPSCW